VFHAAEYGNEAIMALLLRENVDLSAAYNYSLLERAAANRDAGVLKLLMAAGVKAEDHMNRVIQTATRNENEQVLAMLMHAVNRESQAFELYGKTIAHMAAQNPNEKILAMLISTGVVDWTVASGLNTLAQFTALQRTAILRLFAC
jgi:ankyrin repeat protein